MQLRRKRAIDYWAGRPLLASLDLAARFLGAIVRRPHPTEPVTTALFVKFQGIGSLVVSKPAIAAFRRAYPGAHTVFWGTPALAEFAAGMPEFDEILVLDDRTALRAARSCAAALVRLWRLRIDWAFDLEVYSRLSFRAFSSPRRSEFDLATAAHLGQFLTEMRLPVRPLSAAEHAREILRLVFAGYESAASGETVWLNREAGPPQREMAATGVGTGNG